MPIPHRILLSYQAGFLPGGAPVGIRNFARALARSSEVHVAGLQGPESIGDPVEEHRFGSRTALVQEAPALVRRLRPDLTIAVGYFLATNVAVAGAARRAGSTVILQPLAQASPHVFATSMFAQGWDVRSIEETRANAAATRLQQARSQISPLKKRSYASTVGRKLNRDAHFVAVLGAAERKQYQQIHARPNGDFITFQWGIDDLPPIDDHNDFFGTELGEDDRLDYVVWARLDYWAKGIDRLLEGIRVAKSRGRLPFRTVLAGPDYKGSSKAIRNHIELAGLSNDVVLALPGTYTPGDLSPLRDADASVLLSPWDGSPRAIRESVALGTPVIVSPETNFDAEVRSTGAGLVADHPDDPEAVADVLLQMADSHTRARCTDATAALASFLDWDGVADRFLDEVSARR